MGQAGDGESFAPSVSNDGEVVAFASFAGDLGAAPVDDEVAGLFVWDEGSIEMVTDAGMDGGVGEVQISGDGQVIAFTSTAGNLLDGTTLDTGIERVYVAERSGTGWDIELVSKSSDDERAMSGEEDAASYSPTIDDDGSTVAFLSSADNLDEDVSEPAASGPVLAVRDRAGGQTRVVVKRGSPDEAAFIGAYAGAPRLSPDGERLVVYAGVFESEPTERHDRLLSFDTAKALSSSAATRAGAWIGRGRLRDSANSGLSVDIAGNEADGFTVMFPSINGPLSSFKGSPPSLYVVDGAAIGPSSSSGWHADPVNIATGGFVQDETDLPGPSHLPGAAGISRRYTTGGQQGGLFGPGWTSLLDSRVDVQADGIAAVTTTDGRAVSFAETTSGWLPLDDRRLSFEEADGEVDPGEWRLTDPSGQVLYYSSVGFLTAIVPPAGPSAELTWTTSVSGDPQVHELVSMEWSNGYSVAFTDTSFEWTGSEWQVDPSQPDGTIDRATASDGRQVDYLYDPGTDHRHTPELVGVTRPHLEGQDPATIGWRRYEMQGPLLAAIYQSVDETTERLIVENTFDSRGRVSSQVSETGDVTEFVYGARPDGLGGWTPATTFTTATDTASGDVTVYEFNTDGEVVGITDALGRSVSRGWDDGHPLTTSSRSGIDTDHSYDAAGRVEQVTQTLDSEVRVVESLSYVTSDSSPAAVSDDRVASRTDAAGVTTTYSYDGASRFPESVSVPCDPDSTSPELPCDVSGLATTTYTYFTGDLEGLVESQTDPDGVVTEFTYHADRSLASQTVFDGEDPLTTTFETVRVGDTEWDPAWPALAIEARITRDCRAWR